MYFEIDKVCLVFVFVWCGFIGNFSKVLLVFF